MALSSLLRKLSIDFPDVTFREHDDFVWSPSNRTVSYDPTAAHAAMLLLHELSHAILGHADYKKDIELIGLERDAWTRAEQLGVQYGVDFPVEAIDESMDTYRDWLHRRSLCESCGASGVQRSVSQYLCMACGGSWRPVVQ